MRALYAWLVLASAAATLAACSEDVTEPPSDEARYFEFTTTSGEQEAFIAKTSDATTLRTLDSLLALPFEQRDMHINGEIARGDDGYNLDWSWHFVPDAWGMAEVSIEVCDGSLSGVESDLDYWIGEVGRFCPWDSRVVEEVEPTT